VENTVEMVWKSFGSGGRGGFPTPSAAVLLLSECRLPMLWCVANIAVNSIAAEGGRLCDQGKIQVHTVHAVGWNDIEA
jgi:hypothetical protein